MIHEIRDAVRYDIEIMRGDDFVRTFMAVYQLSNGSSATVDMSGWTARCQVREVVDGPVLIEANTSNGRMITGPQSNGQGDSWQLLLSFTQGDTAALPAGFIGVYDIELTRPDGYRKTWYYGRACVQGDVTHG